MVNTILASEIIYERLTSSEALQEVVSSRIFPVLAEQGTSCPFIVFTRESVSSNDISKDLFRQDDLSFSVTVVSKGYLEGAQIANVVRSIFDVHTISSESANIVLDNITLSSADENFGDDAYEQVLTFSAVCVNHH